MLGSWLCALKSTAKNTAKKKSVSLLVRFFRSGGQRQRHQVSQARGWPIAPPGQPGTSCRHGPARLGLAVGNLGFSQVRQFHQVRQSAWSASGRAAAGSDPYVNLIIRPAAAKCVLICAETCRKPLRYPAARHGPVIGETPVFVLRNVRGNPVMRCAPVALSSLWQARPLVSPSPDSCFTAPPPSKAGLGRQVLEPQRFFRFQQGLPLADSVCVL